MSQTPPPVLPQVNRALERKIDRARWAGLFEQLWLRVWIRAGSYAWVGGLSRHWTTSNG